LIALREPIIELFFQQGKFSASDTTATAWALLF
jgi:peptidoglycan biosynthesis protein MviN/MurJ (putative lipid II flippase)